MIANEHITISNIFWKKNYKIPIYDLLKINKYFCPIQINTVGKTLQHVLKKFVCVILKENVKKGALSQKYKIVLRWFFKLQTIKLLKQEKCQ